MTTKILALTDALGNLVRFDLLPGHRYDTVGVPPLLDGLDLGALIADKAFDSNAIIADLNARGAKVVISQHPRRAKKLPLDAEMYKWRHLIENFFCKLKEFKRTLWTLDKIPATASMKEDSAKVKLNAPFTPSPQILIFRTVDFPPAPPPHVLAKMDKDMFMKLAGNEAPKKGRPPNHPFTHRTDTIDMAVVISGEIDMVLDDSTVHLKPGDVVVQQETNHAWVNNGKEICRIAFVQVTANEP